LEPVEIGAERTVLEGLQLASCTNLSRPVGSGQGDLIQTTKCPLAEEIFLDKEISKIKGSCMSTRCLIEHDTQNRTNSSSSSCRVACPSNLKSYRDTVVIRDAAKELLVKAAEHCNKHFSIGDDEFELAPHQMATWDRHDWNGANSRMFTLAIIVWALLRSLVIALSWDEFIGYDKAWWEGVAPGFTSILDCTQNWLEGLVLKTKFIWLVTPANAMLTFLSTLQLHSDCSQLVLFNIPEPETFFLVVGCMSYVFLIFIAVLISVCFKPCEVFARWLFMMSIFVFVLAGCLLKWQDIVWSGFTMSFFLGINPAIVFDFAWPDSLLSVSFSAIRVLLFVLALSDLVEEFSRHATRIYKAHGKIKGKTPGGGEEP